MAKKGKVMSRKILLSFAFLFFFSSLLHAQTTGKISGKIIDKKDGLPLIGVNVLLEGTTWGAATDINGDFFIINIPPGTYQLRAQMLGYETVIIQGIQVSVNRTSNLEIEMGEGTIELGEEVVVTADKVSSKKDQTGSIRNVSTDQIKELPVDNLGEVVNMQAGVVKGHFRGGRSNEVSYMVDGMLVNESFASNGKAVDVEKEVVQEVEVITGTFNAEYGNAMSGVVNAITKDGGNEFHGSVSSHIGGYPTTHHDVFIGMNKEAKDYIRNTDYRFFLSGPIVPNTVSFLVNGRYQNSDGYLNGIRRFNVDDYSIFSNQKESWYSEHNGDGKYVPMNGSEAYSIFTKFSYKPVTAIRTAISYSKNNEEYQGYNHSYKYNPGGMPTTYHESDLLSLHWNHTLGKSLFYEIKASYLNDFTGYYVYENPLDPKYVHDIYSRNDPGFYTGGQSKSHIKRTYKDLNFKFDITWQANKNHTLKSGIQFIQHDIDNQASSIRNSFLGSGLETVSYFDSIKNKYVFPNYNPEILSDSSLYSDIYKVKPREGAFYIQDKMEFDDMVVNLGVRVDYFDPNTVYPTNPRNPSNMIRFPDNPEKMSSYPKADPHIQVSPRLGLSYQLGDAALLRFAYGHFFQMPPLYALYDNHSFVVSPKDFETTMGNPLVRPQKTVQYEIGLWQQLMDGMGLEVAVFYRDIYDLLGTKIIATYNQVNYGLYTNKDYGNAKGLEVKFDYVLDNFTVFVNYTLQYTKGNADNPTFSFNRAGNSIDPVNRLIRMSWDQRHTLNASVGYNTTGFGATLTGYLNSGTPYTWEPISESPLARVNLFPNNSPKPTTVSLDLSAYYNVLSIDNYNIRLTLLVKNLLDTLNEEGVYNKTGRAYNDIVRPSDVEGHKSDFNTYYDRIKNPAMYSAPREVKLGLEFSF